MVFNHRKILALILFAGTVFAARGTHAYPNEEKAQLLLSGVTAEAAQMHLTSDNRYLYLGFNNKVKVVDMGTFDLREASYQPYDFGSSTEYNGVVGGIALSSARLYVTKDDGKMLYFELSDLTAEPHSVTISSGVELGKVAINSAYSKLYIVDKDNNKIIVHTITSAENATIDLSPSVSGAAITDMILVPALSGGNDYIYVATDKGLVFAIADGNTTASEGAVAVNTHNLLGLGIRPGKDYLYVIDSTAKAVLVLNATTLALVDTVDLMIDEDTHGNKTYNESPTGLVSATVTNPSSTYTFISGLYGVSVLDGDNNLIDVDTSGNYDYDPITIANDRYGPMLASSDGYLYMSNADGSISVITDKPYVTVSSVTYSSGGSSMSNGESVTITFQSDVDGTYNVLVGGSIDQSGTQATDADATGSVTAATDKQVTISYDNNSSAFQEGSNYVFIFVTDSGDRVGRDATTVSVDTPPPAVTVTSTGFGNTRVYINMTRLTVSDMNHYNVYVSTDPDAVVNKTVSATSVAQPSSGSTVTAEISGLANATLYYASVEAVDNAGNIGPLTYTFADGSRITATPEQTIGPAELSGEKGCSLVAFRSFTSCRRVGVILLSLIIVMLFLVRVSPPATQARLRARRAGVRGIYLVLLVLIGLFLFPMHLFAEEATPQWWTTELKGGFWMPTGKVMKQFFEPCCHMTGAVEQGFLYKSKYGVEVGVGILSENGTAVGATFGTASQDRFNLFLLPMETNLTFRADFLENQILVPYVKFGFDYIYFRESLKGAVTQGVKTGLHTVGGVQILLDMIDQGARSTMEEDFGINDVYLTLDGRYNWVNSFGGKGLNLSSLIFSFGLLFEY